jgi:hypothetical protein
VYGILLDAEGVAGAGARLIATHEDWLAELERLGESPPAPSDADMSKEDDEAVAAVM